jgi:hypothetical protein
MAEFITDREQTHFRKSSHGWLGETYMKINGVPYLVSTMKNHQNIIQTTAQKVLSNDRSNGITAITFSPLQDKSILICTDQSSNVATEQRIKVLHLKALALIDEKQDLFPKPDPEPEIGDIIFMDGYGKSKGSNENHHIIYKIEGHKLLCVEKDTLELTIKSHVRPIAKLFGIGMYFEKGFNMQKFGITDDKLANMLIEAQEVKKVKNNLQRIADEESTRKAEEHRRYLSQFKQADRRKTTNIIKAHCMKTWKIAKIEVGTEVFSGGDSMRVKYYSPKRIPELESFIKGFQYGHFNAMEDIYETNDNRQEIILDGHILQDYKYVFCSHEKAELPEPKRHSELVSEPVESDLWETLFDAPLPECEAVKGNLKPETLNLQLVRYSDRAIALIGDTKQIKDKLRELWGSYNPNLKINGQIVKGWVFSAKRESQLRQLIAS